MITLYQALMLTIAFGSFVAAMVTIVILIARHK